LSKAYSETLILLLSEPILVCTSLLRSSRLTICPLITVDTTGASATGVVILISSFSILGDVMISSLII
jgi:hypothetical protein